MACAHHRRLIEEFEFHRSAAATTVDHQKIPVSKNDTLLEQYMNKTRRARSQSSFGKCPFLRETARESAWQDLTCEGAARNVASTRQQTLQRFNDPESLS
jgi:hypothetical protein